MDEKVGIRDLFLDWPWTAIDAKHKNDVAEWDRWLRERLSNTSPDWYDTPAGLLLGWSLVGAVAAGVAAGLFVAPLTTLLGVIAAGLVLAVAG